MRVLLTAMTAAAALCSTSVMAKQGLTVMGQAEREFTETVQFGDLNLADGAAAGALRHRVLAASSRVCADAHGDNNMGGRLVSACTTGTYRDARPAIAQAIAMVESGKQLAATSILIRVAMR